MTKKRIGAGLLLVLVALATVAMGTRHPSHDGPNPVALAAVVEGSPSGSTSPSSQDDALVILSTLDLASFYQTLAVVRNNGGEVPQGYPPNAFVATLNPGVDLALSQHPSVARIERGVTDPASLTALGGQAELVAHIWNTVFRGVPDPIAAAAPSGPPPERQGPDFVIPPPEAPGVPTVPAAPTSTQTSEFMAGIIVFSVVFVESSGGVGNCSPADPQTENWDAGRQTTVLLEIGEGLAFWTSRSGAPSPLTFLLDNWGTQPTSCEPINRTFGERGLWIADVLTAMGFPATPANYYDVARSFANARRTALGADWGFVIFVVDSLNDRLNDPITPGSFSDGRDAWGDLNGPTQGLTYDNDGWGISRMNLVSLHETGHNFGALDEYVLSDCLITDSWGYLNVPNASCNNGGDTSDRSVMGEGEELVNPSVDVSTSARGAIGWRNPVPPVGTPAVVDVVRTATVSLTIYTPDPTSDSTPTYSASAGNTPYPPGGLNQTSIPPRQRQPLAVTVSRVAAAQWNLDGGPFIIGGVVPTDGAFDQESELYTCTPPLPVANGTHIFRTRSTNNFGHISSAAPDCLTIGPGVACLDRDGDGFIDDSETYLGTDALDDCPDNTSDPAWPLDQDNSGQITFVGDENQYAGNMFLSVGPCPGGAKCRLDLDTSGVIAFVGDENKYAGRMLEQCVQ